MANLTEASLKQLKQFIELVKSNSDVLHSPQLQFFKDYLQSLHATIPPKKSSPVEEVDDDEPVGDVPPPKQEYKPEKKQEKKEEKKEEPKVEEVEEEEDPDPHLLTQDSDYESIEMGDPNKMVSEDDDGDSMSLMGQGRKAARENNHNVAIEKLTEAILLNPQGSALFATRAESFLVLKRPNAAIRDCNRALQLNPDSSKALKTRGKARRYIGKYGEAYHDLQQGNLLDWDEATDAMIKEIKERGEKAIQNQRKNEEKKRVEELKREAAEKRRRQQEEEDKRNREQEYAGGMGGMGAAGMSGMAALYEQLTKDPEIGNLIKNQEIQQKLMEFFMSGGQKHADDPVVIKVTEALKKRAADAPSTRPTSTKKPEDDLD